MHKIEGKQPRAEKSVPAAFKEPLGKHVHNGNHPDAEQRAHDPPSKCVHAEKGHAQHDKYLPQRRVGVFIRNQAVQMLIGRAGMIKLIKIHAV
ncbi:hypothetical protein SDC9_178327 [bioreactor metagenome]|uniref:Uncharacterized protein n=1 Tax=bioreactor metagenome TaxID=1076179 RepID=A0A645GX73_9ZZZZ